MTAPFHRASIMCLMTLLFACGSSESSSEREDASPDAGAVDVTDVTTADAGGPDATVGADAGRPDASDAGAPPADADGPTDADGAADTPAPEDTTEDSGADVPEPRVATAIETSIAGTEIRAGEVFRASCAVTDADGDPIPVTDPAAFEIRIQPSNTAEPVDGERGAFRMTEVGDFDVACTAPALLLIDATPTRVQVAAGDAAEVWASVRPNVTVAGEVVEVSCVGFDAFGNRTGTAGLSPLVQPSARGTVVDEDAAVVTEAGRYDVVCTSPGAETLVPDVLDVVAAAPASIELGLRPERTIYGLGEVLTLEVVVADRFGNAIDDPRVTYSSAPTMPSFGDGRFRLAEEGEIVFTADAGEGLSASATIVVNGRGPSIRCDEPANGAMLDQAPGEVTIRGTVADALGVGAVRVGDTPAVLFDDGTFEATVEVGWGITFVDVIAADTEGLTNSTTCSFLVSDDWIAEGASVADGVTLALGQSAIDDGDRGGSLNSLGDVLDVALDSDELIAAIDGQLAGSGRLLNECFVDLGFLGCALRATVDYVSARVDGPNDVTLRLVDGGLQGAITIRNAAVRLNIGGTFSTSGWVFLSSMALDVTFDLRLSNGVPRLTFRSSSTPNLGSIDTDFSGITGELLDFLFPLFEGTVKNALRDGINGFIRNDLDDVLDGVVSGLDISSLGTSFDVPRLDGSGAVSLGFGLQITTIDVNTQRALFGVGTRFSAPVTRPGPTEGAAYPPGSLRLDPPLTRSVAAGVHVVLLNQAIHALWRARFFDATLDLATLGLGLPAGARATLSFALPPVVQGDLAPGATVEVGVGGIGAEIVVPGLFDAPLVVELGAHARATATITAADELAFTGLELTELRFATPDASLSPETRDVLDALLSDLLDAVLTDALNDALPTLPIPSFALPDSLTEFGLPGGAVLGVVSPSLDASRTHFVVQGNFGVQ